MMWFIFNINQAGFVGYGTEIVKLALRTGLSHQNHISNITKHERYVQFFVTMVHKLYLPNVPMKFRLSAMGLLPDT